MTGADLGAAYTPTHTGQEQDNGKITCHFKRKGA